MTPKRLLLDDRVPGLDLLRSIATLMVVFFHYALANKGSRLAEVAHFGWTGVDLFFVLSGYLIAGQYFAQRARGKPITLKTFYGRRILRTWPNYLVMVGVTLLFPLYFGKITALWRFLTFTQNFGMPEALGVSWSLCVEEHFYLVFPLIAFWALKAPRARKGARLFVSIFLFGLLVRLGMWLYTRPLEAFPTDYDGALALYVSTIYYPTPVRLDGLLCGVGLAVLKWFKPGIWARIGRHSNRMTIAGLLVLAFTAWLLRQEMTPVGAVSGYPLLALGFGLLTAAAAHRESFIGKLRVPGAKQLALLSFAIYLTHVQAMMLAHEAALRVPEPWQGNAERLYCLVFILALASALHWAVERPFLFLRERVTPLP